MSKTQPSKSKVEAKYDSSSITVLEGLEAVRVRPGMYIGNTSVAGLHHLIWEVVDNSIDEAMAGHADLIEVFLRRDGSVEVVDNGRGIPIDKHPQTGISTLTTVLTILHAGGKFGGDGYKVSGGLHGVGISVVNALSEELAVEVRQGGKVVRQEFRRGVPQTKEPVKVGSVPKGETGTRVIFRPDPTIFETVEFDQALIIKRLRQRAFLSPGVSIRFQDERKGVDPFDETFRYDGGVADFVTYLAEGEKPITKKPFVFSGEMEVGDVPVMVDVAVLWTASYDENVRSFVNTIATVDGGTHEEGFFRACTRVINDAARRYKVLGPKEANFQGSDVREGMVAVISVRMPEPQFEGQTKGKLGSSAARTATESLVGDALADWLAQDSKTAKAVLNRIKNAAKARAAARAAKDLTRRKSALASGNLPRKLSECRQKTAEGTELFLVEGDSAGGSAKKGRDSNFQAILPLRGKILNVYKTGVAKMLSNRECSEIVTAIGGGVGREFDLSKTRYEKIILMLDADADGSHIRVLLLTLLWKHMRPLLEAGRVFVAQPPLYRNDMGRGEVIYTYTQAQQDKLIASGRNIVSVSRFKGLGEMDAELLWETTMNPSQRTLRLITVDDAERAAEMFDILMGNDASERRTFITQHARDIEDIDVV